MCHNENGVIKPSPSVFPGESEFPSLVYLRWRTIPLLFHKIFSLSSMTTSVETPYMKRYVYDNGLGLCDSRQSKGEKSFDWLKLIQGEKGNGNKREKEYREVKGTIVNGVKH